MTNLGSLVKAVGIWGEWSVWNREKVDESYELLGSVTINHSNVELILVPSDSYDNTDTVCNIGVYLDLSNYTPGVYEFTLLDYEFQEAIQASWFEVFLTERVPNEQAEIDDETDVLLWQHPDLWGDAADGTSKVVLPRS